MSKSTAPRTINASNTQTKQLTDGSGKPKPPSLSRGFSKEQTRKAGALARLLKNSNVSLDQVRAAPPVEEILASIGSRKKIITAMRFSQEECVQRVLKIYDASPEFDRERSGLPLEAFILAAGVNPNELIGAVIMAFRTMQAQKSGLMALKHHPRVLEKTIWFGQFRDGFRDRQMLHQAVGFLPSPKGGGSSSSINLNFSQPEKAPEAVNEDGMTAPDINEVFPMISDRLPAWQEARQKALKEKD